MSNNENTLPKRKDRQVFHVDYASPEQINELIELVSRSEMPPGFEHLDELLKDWEPPEPPRAKG